MAKISSNARSTVSLMPVVPSTRRTLASFSVVESDRGAVHARVHHNIIVDAYEMVLIAIRHPRRKFERHAL